LNESLGEFPRRYREGLISAISAGFFFVLIGAIFIIRPDLFDRILGFFRSFKVVQVPNTTISFPAPEHPFAFAHSVIYEAAERFGYAFGFFQIVILVLRFTVRSPLSKKAETVSNLIFWLGAGYLTRTFLIETTRFSFLLGMTRWFAFWSVIIMLIGISLIIRAIILAAASTIRAT